jgi:hypothetical protein
MENLQHPWNCFHTLTERTPAVKSESQEANLLDWFSSFLPEERGSAEPVEETVVDLVC